MKLTPYFIGFSLIPIVGWTMSSPVTTDITTTTTTKVMWLEQVKTGVAVPLCKSFIEDETISIQMKKNNIDYDKCISLMPRVTNDCIKKYDMSLPATISDVDADKWGRVIGQCIGNNFALSYLYNESNQSAPQ